MTASRRTSGVPPVSRDFGWLRQQLLRHGVTRAYFKPLAPNDNSKNQIYLWPGLKSLNEVPTGELKAVTSDTPGEGRFHARVQLEWLGFDGSLSPAPAAKLILYPQYPEVRLSGFLMGSRGAPSAILAGRAKGRVLVLGVALDGRVIGYAAAPATPIAEALLALTKPGEHALRELPLRGAVSGDSRTLVLAEMLRIHRSGWLNSEKLSRSGELSPCESSQCGGYTLEAQLGIAPNGVAEPDYLGWEIKQFGVRTFEKPSGVLTLMTPEPDGGVYKTDGVEAFVRRFGYADKRGRSDRLNFGGLHRFGARHVGTGLSLQLDGYDEGEGKIVNPFGALALVDNHSTVAASWAFEKLLVHWRRKHRQALIAVSQLRTTPNRQYRYGPRVWLGVETDFLRLLGAIASGKVYYDPGIKLTDASSARPRTKRRSQFRVKFSDLDGLYERFEPVDLSG